MSTARMLLQLVFALVVVLGLMWAASKGLRRAGGRSGGALEVVARRQLSRGASVSVVRLGERALVLGVTDSTVTMITELPVSDLPSVTGRVVREEVPVDSSATPALGQSAAGASRTTTGPLAGSALSPGTWRTALEVLRERTARRG